MLLEFVAAKTRLVALLIDEFVTVPSNVVKPPTLVLA